MSCKKMDYGSATLENTAAVFRSWLIVNGERYKSEAISIKSSSGEMITGRLDWNEFKNYMQKGQEYFEVPFMVMQQKEKIKIYKDGEMPAVSFALVFRYNASHRIDAALRTKTYFNDLTSAVSIRKGSTEIFESLKGEWINGWFIDNYDNYVKIVPKGKSISYASCISFSTKQYVSACFDNGTVYNGTSCGRYPIIVSYSFCYDDNPPSNEEFQPDFGSGGTGSAPPPEIIKDTSIAKAPNVDCLLEKLLGTGMTQGLDKILQNIKDGGVTVVYKLADIPTKGSTVIVDTKTIEVRLRREWAIDPAVSRIQVAKTIIHETYHAKLRKHALEVLGTNEISTWPKNIDDMTLAELSYYYEQSAKANQTWNSIGHQWMLNHIDECVVTLKEFIQTYYPSTFNVVGSDNLKYIALFYNGLEDVSCFADDMASRGLTLQLVTSYTYEFNYDSSSCPQ
jgi:hypothetical protein